MSLSDMRLRASGPALYVARDTGTSFAFLPAHLLALARVRLVRESDIAHRSFLLGPPICLVPFGHLPYALLAFPHGNVGSASFPSLQTTSCMAAACARARSITSPHARHRCRSMRLRVLCACYGTLLAVRSTLVAVPLRCYVACLFRIGRYSANPYAAATLATAFPRSIP